jgi:type VI secretion system protein ImpM
MLGSTWLDKYLMAPIWRFVIGPNVLGENAWIGIMVPSVDRVGRYFPLTLAKPINPDIDIVATYLDNSEWFKSLENLGIDALSQELNFAEFELHLAGLPAPAAIVDMEAGESTIPVLNKVFLSSYFSLPAEGDHGDYISQISKVIAGSRHPTSLWGSELVDTQEHFLLVTENLPGKERFCSFLDKTFEAHGWVDASKNGIANNLS